MKTLLTIAIALLLAQALQAQIPDPVKNPKAQTSKLTEWWRADNMGYGGAGATWIDNFYNGKGALVISTPTGVQTWQMRYPWDTVNIFTWAGGDANIKTADFNGDGLTDYIDGKGYVYLGVANGLPANLPAVRINMDNTVLERILILDIDHDGLSDVVDIGIGNRKYFRVSYGKSDAREMVVDTISTGDIIDDYNFVIQGFGKTNNKFRVVLRHYNYTINSHPPYTTVTTDGFRLYDISWHRGDKSTTNALLDEYSYNTPTEGDPLTTSVLQLSKDTTTLVVVTSNVQNSLRTTISVYDLSSDHFSGVAKMQADSLMEIQQANGLAIRDALPSLCLKYIKQLPTCRYSMQSKFNNDDKPTLTWVYNDASTVFIDERLATGVFRIMNAGSRFDGVHDKSYMTVWTRDDSTVSIVGFDDRTKNNVLSVTQIANTSDRIIKITLEFPSLVSDWSLVAYNEEGRVCRSFNENSQDVTKSDRHIEVQCKLPSAGMYLFSCRYNDQSVSLKFIQE